jgi:hypothetical protein
MGKFRCQRTPPVHDAAAHRPDDAFRDDQPPKILQLGPALEYSLVTNMYTGVNRTRTHYPEGWVIWVSRYLQIGVEAIVPIDPHSGPDLGFRAQAHRTVGLSFPIGTVSRSSLTERA